MSGGCSLQRAGSCSLQGTGTRPHQMCERGLAQKDCISLSYLWRMLEMHRLQLRRTVGSNNRRYLSNISDTVMQGEESCPHLSDAGWEKFLANISSQAPVTRMKMCYIITGITCASSISRFKTSHDCCAMPVFKCFSSSIWFPALLTSMLPHLINPLGCRPNKKSGWCTSGPYMFMV